LFGGGSGRQFPVRSLVVIAFDTSLQLDEYADDASIPHNNDSDDNVDRTHTLRDDNDDDQQAVVLGLVVPATLSMARNHRIFVAPPNEPTTVGNDVP
jgi:hypothetical protein